MVGLIPLLPTSVIPARIAARGQALGKRFASFLDGLHITDERLREGGYVSGRPGARAMQLSVVPPARLERLLGEMLSEDEFLSPHGLRALSQRHRDGAVPARPRRACRPRSTTSRANRPPGLFGGNSNWRGPVWFPTQLPRHPVAAELGRLDGRRLHGRVPDRFRDAAPAARRGDGPRPPAGLDLAARRRGPPAGLRLVSRSSRPIRTGTTCCCSMSTSTATPAPASAPRTRPAGPGSSPT